MQNDECCSLLLQDDATVLDISTMRRWNLVMRVFVAEYLTLQPKEGSTQARHGHINRFDSELVSIPVAINIVEFMLRSLSRCVRSHGTKDTRLTPTLIHVAWCIRENNIANEVY